MPILLFAAIADAETGEAANFVSDELVREAARAGGARSAVYLDPAALDDPGRDREGDPAD